MARTLTTARRALAALAFFGAAAGAGSAWAESVQQTLSQLANASPNATQLGLRSRGYALAASDAAGDKAWQYWWNGREAACVLMATTGGRVDRLAVSSESDCNQMNVDQSRMTSQGKVAVAAAKLLGVNTLMHKSHQRDASRYDDYKDVANFEQGWRDGVNKAPFRERERERNNVAYADGFKAGQAKAQAVPAVVAAPAAVAGPDYQNGFRDGFNKQDYRDRDRDRRSKAYAAGFKAGQAKSTAIVASGPDFELGYRDGFNKIEYRDRDRKNRRYAEGYKAGQREMTALSRPATTRPMPPLAAALPDVTQLLGRRDPDYVTDLRQMGYTQRNNYTQGDDGHAIWRGKDPNDCVHTMQRDGVVKKVERIEAANCR